MDSSRNSRAAGLCNSKALNITPAEASVVLSKTKPTKGKGKPAKRAASTVMKKDMRRMARAVTKEVENFRPDLKVRRPDQHAAPAASLPLPCCPLAGPHWCLADCPPQKAALAKLFACQKSLRVIKAGPKKAKK